MDDRRSIERLATRLTVRPSAGSTLEIGPRSGWVGSVRLPSGRRGIVRPKIAIASMFDLLALAYRTMSPPPRVGAALASRAQPTDWFALQLVSEIEFLLAQGLRRGYVTTTERLPHVRGRIVWRGSLGSSPGLVE